MTMVRAAGVALMACAGSAAVAGETPLYAPAPAWITPAPAIDSTGTQLVVLYDSQQRLEKGVVTSYLDMATRAANAAALNQMGTVTLPWMPDKGDLTIHRVEIVRGAETIDVLKTGARFTVLRREEQLEQRTLTGLLTATMTVEGLRVGDVLRVTMSMTQRDPAAQGQVQSVAATPATPFRAQFARVRMLWPAADTIAWKAYGDGAAPVTHDVAGGYRELVLPLPLPKQPDLPQDMPARFAKPLLIEASSFASWPQVSKTLAPLYATEGLIEPGGPIASEVKAIMAASADPRVRAQAALLLVQDKIRYMAMAMGTGNMTPQPPARTWALRYGDCKAKTLLLLAILHAMGIEADAVAASLQADGLVVNRLPGAAAFDHVFVRATIAGSPLWLDGTGTGSRLADLDDVPAVTTVLPLLPAGAALATIPRRANARADIVVTSDVDESAGLDTPAIVKASIAYSGQRAGMIAAAFDEATGEQRNNLIGSLVTPVLGEMQFVDPVVRSDAATGTTTVAVTGLRTTGWRRADGRYRQPLTHAFDIVKLDADRARAAWRAIPVTTGNPDTIAYRTVIHLPRGLDGVALEGEPALSGKLAGRIVTRSTSVARDTITIDERIDVTGEEIAPETLSATKAALAQARNRAPVALAPASVPLRFQLVDTAKRDGRYAPIEALFARVIAAQPKEANGYSSRGSMRRGIYDRAGALADYGKAIEIEPTAWLYSQRASIFEDLGQHDKALADYQEALRLDPDATGTVDNIAEQMSETGDRDGAMSMIEERIAQGGKARPLWLQSKVTLLTDFGDGAQAVDIARTALTDAPNDENLLNALCWAEGTRSQSLDTAARDCTRAVEASRGDASALDSRAMAYYRLNRDAEALADLDAALAIAPSTASSLFLRAVVKTRMGKAAAAKQDLAYALVLDPQIERRYARRYGIKMS